MIAFPFVFLGLSFHTPVRHVHNVLPFLRIDAHRTEAHARRHRILRYGHEGEVLLRPHHEVLGNCDPLQKIPRTRQCSFAYNLKHSKGKEGVEPTATTRDAGPERLWRTAVCQPRSLPQR